MSQIYYRRRNPRFEGQILTERDDRWSFSFVIAVSLAIGIAALVAVWF